jgi:hypothetical protein
LGDIYVRENIQRFGFGDWCQRNDSHQMPPHCREIEQSLENSATADGLDRATSEDDSRGFFASVPFARFRLWSGS